MAFSLFTVRPACTSRGRRKSVNVSARTQGARWRHLYPPQSQTLPVANTILEAAGRGSQPFLCGETRDAHFVATHAQCTLNPRDAGPCTNTTWPSADCGYDRWMAKRRWSPNQMAFCLIAKSGVTRVFPHLEGFVLFGLSQLNQQKWPFSNYTFLILLHLKIWLLNSQMCFL